MLDDDHFASATVPHSGHLRIDSLLIQFWMTGLSCVPKSVQWNASSRMIVGFSCFPDLQYHRKRYGGSGMRTYPVTNIGMAQDARSAKSILTDGALGTDALDDDPYGVRKSHGVVRGVRCAVIQA